MLMYMDVFHSRDCSMILCIIKIWSIQPLPFWKPGFSCLSLMSMTVSTPLRRTLQSNLLGTDRRMIPHQLLQFLVSPFLWMTTESLVFRGISVADVSEEVCLYLYRCGDIGLKYLSIYRVYATCLSIFQGLDGSSNLNNVKGVEHFLDARSCSDVRWCIHWP